jgi:hypothetical protein
MNQTQQLVANAPYEFIVNGTFASYQWYLNGDPAGTGASFIFNQPPGVYELVVVATNSLGEQRSGRCRVTAAGP